MKFCALNFFSFVFFFFFLLCFLLSCLIETVTHIISAVCGWKPETTKSAICVPCANIRLCNVLLMMNFSIRSAEAECYSPVANIIAKWPKELYIYSTLYPVAKVRVLWKLRIQPEIKIDGIFGVMSVHSWFYHFFIAVKICIHIFSTV